ncbi:MAG: SpoIIE family protein phosphatase [Candidatus Riflebacteria bacterium]|nr:SpoIIE family protein phosphatase [Candidatus Riflebacteria bacterium]
MREDPNNIPDKEQTPFQSYIRWMGICLFFFALPLLMLAFGLGKNWDRIESQSYTSIKNELDKQILRVKRFERTEFFFAAILKRAFRKAEKNKDFSGTLKKFLFDLKNSFPDYFYFYVTDSKNELLSGLSDSNSPRIILKKISEIFSEIQHNKPDGKEKLKAAWSLIKGFIGDLSLEEQFFQPPSELIEVSTEDKKRWFFWHSGKKGNLFVHINHFSSWPTISMKYLCNSLNKQSAENLFRFDLYSYNTPSEVRSLPNSAYNFFKTSMPSFSDKNLLYSFQNIGSNSILQASTSLSRVKSFFFYRIALSFAITLVFAFLSLKAFPVMILGKTFRMTLASRLIILFLFAAGTPLLVMVFSGWDYLQSLSEARIRQFQSNAKQTLRSIETGFPKMLKEIEDSLSKIAKSSIFSNDQERKLFTERLRKFSKVANIDDCYLVDHNSSIVWSVNSTNENNRQVRYLLKGICPDLLDSVNYPEARLNPVKKSAGRYGERLVRDLSVGFGKLKELSLLGNIKTFDWFHPISSGKKHSTFMLVVHFRLDSLVELFFNRALKKHPPRLKDAMIVCDHNSNFQILSGSFSKSRVYRKILKTLALFQNEAFDIFPITKDVNFIAAGIKSKEFENVFFAAICSDNFIKIEQIKTTGLFLAFSFLCGLISLYLTHLLSTDFFNPIAAISNAVKAVSSHDFKHRIQLEGQKEEFLTLSKTFNGVLENLQDLELGRIVQESLFPDSTLRSKEFEVCGRSFPASQLGGDYFDLRKLPEGRLLILIGDVSGHGVPAGLVMAMAQALTDAFIFQNASNLSSLKPERILEFIQSLLFTQLVKLPNMLTCFIGIVDPAGGGFSFSNAGHHQPFLFSASGKSSLLATPFSPPLMRKRAPGFSSGFQKMEPGDLLLLYTDGLIEAHKTTGEELGYAFLSTLSSEINSDLSDSINRVMTRLNNLTQNHSQEDDITLILLSRNFSR